MLIGFKIKNFRSFDELQHFSMIAGKTRNFNEHICEKKGKKILKFSSRYGANASGKSNLVLAIDLGKKMILSNSAAIFYNQYFRFDKNNIDKSSYFEYEIEKNGRLYSYGFEVNVNKKIIDSEWLIDMTSPKELVIFEKDNINKTFHSNLKFDNKDDKNRFDICKKDMKDNNNILFLSEMNRRIMLSKEKNDSFKDFINVFDFFVNDLQIILPNQKREIQFNYFSKFKDEIKPLLFKLGLDITDLVEYNTTMDEIKDKLKSEYSAFIEQFNQEFNKFKKAKGYKFEATLRIENSIYTISYVENEEGFKVKAIKVIHGDPDVPFDTYEESDGTLRILELIDVLLSDEKVYIIDEIDRSLHPSLTIEFVKSFLELLKDKNSQLIITTHESRLLDYDILRRDEIWFTDKNEEKATELYSLEQFKDDARFDRKIDKAYLDGRYGAIPIFHEFFEVDNENNK